MGGYQAAMFSRTQQTLDRADSLIRSSLNTMVEAELIELERIMKQKEEKKQARKQKHKRAR